MIRSSFSARRLVVLSSLALTAVVAAACSSGTDATTDEPPFDGGAGTSAAGKSGASGAAGKGGSAVAGAGGSVSKGGSGGTSTAGTGGTSTAGTGGSSGATAGTGGSGTGGTDEPGTGGASSSTKGGAAGADAGGSAGSTAGGSDAGGSSAGGSDAGSNAGGSDAGSNAGGSDAGSSAGGSDAGSNAGGSDAGSNAGGSDAGSSAGGSDAGSAGSGGGAPLGGNDCSDDSQCASGHCIEGTEGKKVCAFSCKDSCDDPLFRCATIAPVGQSVYQICVPRFALACRPCDFDSQCRVANDQGDKSRCIPNGNAGSFCATDCSTTGCEQGYVCEDRLLPGGNTVQACVPANGDLCQCKDFWAGRGYKTTCKNANGFGTCGGSRICDDTGLTACDARQPSLEVCDGIDSDCDGSIDDFVNCDDGISCTTDTCASDSGGGASCKSTVKPNTCLIGLSCIAGGTVNPQNACQVCDPTKSTSGWSNNDGITCNDGNSCTDNDKCVAGSCGGTPKTDQYEPNQTKSAAKAAPAWDDCTGDFAKSVTGTLYGQNDEDWFSASYTDTSSWTCSVNPVFRLAPAQGVSQGFEVYYQCKNGDSTPIKSCNGATEIKSGSNIIGCRRSPSASQQDIDADFDCAGVGGDDGGTAYFRIFQNTGALSSFTCQTYTLKYGE